MVKERLKELADPKYREFQKKLIPGVEHILGVRLPQLRTIAREIAKQDYQSYLQEHLILAEKNETYEETMIVGLVIGYLKCDLEEVLAYVKDFVPRINNWAICDSFCSNLKITKKNRDEVFEFLALYLSSSKEYEIRFAVVMLLQYYISENYLDRVFEALDSIHHDGYYVRMAVAWAVSICFIKYPNETLPYLKGNKLDDFTYNKALQKIIESLRIDQETKHMIRSLKRA